MHLYGIEFVRFSHFALAFNIQLHRKGENLANICMYVCHIGLTDL